MRALLIGLVGVLAVVGGARAEACGPGFDDLFLYDDAAQHQPSPAVDPWVKVLRTGVKPKASSADTWDRALLVEVSKKRYVVTYYDQSDDAHGKHENDREGTAYSLKAAPQVRWDRKRDGLQISGVLGVALAGELKNHSFVGMCWVKPKDRL